MAKSSELRLHKLKAGRQVVIAAVSLAFVAVLYDRSAELDPAAIVTLFQTFSVNSWVLAAGFTALSLAAVGCYDILAVRFLRLDVPAGAAFAIGWRATSIAQAVGFGLFSGSLVRWKLLSRDVDVSLWRASQLTGVVTGCFLLGWVAVTSLTVLVTPELPPQLLWLAVLGLWALGAVQILSFRNGSFASRLLPPLRLTVRAAALALIDTSAACMVIYIFLPDAYTSFQMLYVTFLIAYGAGLISGLPGGVGPFELCFLALLAPADPTPLLAALLAYRLVYFVGPAIAAVVMLKHRTKPTDAETARGAPARASEAPAEITLLTLGHLSLIETPYAHTKMLGRQTCNSEILLFDPFGGTPLGYLVARLHAAKQQFRGLLVYKANSATAAAARALGMPVHQIGCEAVLTPARFTLEGPRCAQLRRKLRKCAKLGVRVSQEMPDMDTLSEIDRVWQAKNGPPRGFSMGQVTAQLVRRQMFFTAFLKDQPIAFVSFHQSNDRWVMDLIRSRPDAPDGTRHALIHAAIGAAADHGVGTLSLCSAPLYLATHPRTWLEHLTCAIFQKNKAARGLHQFKSSFDPEWKPQFVAADRSLTLLLSGLELYRLINAPRPPDEINLAATHDDYDDYQFDSCALACEEAH